jgi:ketosteroid isomerase-like protein
MRQAFALVLTCVLALSVAVGQKSGKGNVEEEITKLEQEAAQAFVKDGVAAVDKYEADDIMSIDPMGVVTDKSQDKQAFSSGETKLQSIDESDVKVRVYGNTAVALGTQDVKGTYKGQDISGKYRFTDVWVKRGGKWQIVSSQVTKIQQ